MPHSAKPLFALLAFALAVIAGCGSGSSSDEPPAAGLPKEIVIGAAIAKTGYLAPYDGNIAAIEQLVDETNAKGGIDGHKLAIVQVDNRSDPQQAPVAAQKVIEEGADVLLLSCEALTAAAAAPVAEEHDELNFSMCASEPGYGPPIYGPPLLQRQPELSQRGERRSRLPAPAGDQAALPHVRHGDRHGQGPVLRLRTGLGKARRFDRRLRRFRQRRRVGRQPDQRAEGADADAVVMASYPPGGAAAIKQIQAAGIDVPILGGSSFDGTFWLKGIPDPGKIYATSNGSAYDPPDRASARLFKVSNATGSIPMCPGPCWRPTPAAS